MGPITNVQFEDYLERFNSDLIESLQLVQTSTQPWSEFRILSNYTKTLPRKYFLCSLKLIGDVDLSITFTVSYDEFYQVPVCNFRVNKYQGEQEQALTNLCEIDCNGHLVKLDSHPIFDTPWFSIHPCETLQVVDEFMGPETGVLEYLKCWFGLYGLPSVFPMLQTRYI
ncbi:uncharacterized protein CANTADRAFT_265896 [Suhomyces tanzawaensis NRRL Y-17324]|uniref:Uncharacterized protein n=1 Tax=Suhomyces tanzawaensis NRRL Y-17324 TaxID=984487 RepID=A0A1E4SG86_9ASCO|nr:uncharacterized protein CANTADRAFT_265896 [Suhomyces tanzawaensis NRRL Y-17324]ODV78422.1 hypothetical protein CANTADRAFT_265896 [Suhomyces tanzawaensis NRRL Y-17324]